MGAAKRRKSFGKYLKDLRIAKGLTLRKFCRKCGLDPSNASKVERGLLAPSRDTVEKYARCLGLTEGSEGWFRLLDLHYVARQEIPSDLLSDEEVVSKLPVLFRTMRGERFREEKLDLLIERIRRS